MSFACQSCQNCSQKSFCGDTSSLPLADIEDLGLQQTKKIADIRNQNLQPSSISSSPKIRHYSRQKGKKNFPLPKNSKII